MPSIQYCANGIMSPVNLLATLLVSQHSHYYCVFQCLVSCYLRNLRCLFLYNFIGGRKRVGPSHKKITSQFLGHGLLWALRSHQMHLKEKMTCTPLITVQGSNIQNHNILVQRLVGHHNALIAAMTTPPTIVRRMKRQWPTDLFHIAAGD